MIRRLITAFFILSVSALFGYGIYSIISYFTFCTPPKISFDYDLKENYYTKTLPLSITITSDYTLKSACVTLDDKAITVPELPAITGLKKFTANLALPIVDLENGEHKVSFKAHDKSYHANEGTLTATFIVDNDPLKLTFLQKNYTIHQGKTLHVKIESNKVLKKAAIRFLSVEYGCYPQNTESLIYESFIPIDCEQMPINSTMELIACDKTATITTEKIPVIIEAASFPRQKGFVVKDEKLEQEKEVSMNNKILENALQRWLKDSPTEKLWQGPFEKPVEVQSISTPFGEIRTTSARGRYHHKGVDLINRPKSIVWASHHGKVIIKDRFLLTGNTIVLDHGRGVFTLYCHLEDFADIEVGNMLKKGNPIGRLGMTGYASGYHLHWELRVNNISVDPLEWTQNIY